MAVAWVPCKECGRKRRLTHRKSQGAVEAFVKRYGQQNPLCRECATKVIRSKTRGGENIGLLGHEA